MHRRECPRLRCGWCEHCVCQHFENDPVAFCDGGAAHECRCDGFELAEEPAEYSLWRGPA